jgi:hypothetical protein
MSLPAPDVSAAGPDTWRIRVRRELDGVQHYGDVIVRASDVDRLNPPHVSLAGARAWLALGQGFSRDERAGATVAAVKAGLAELGRGYASRTVKNDTGLRVAAAEDLLRTGREADAAAMLLSVLATRIELYRQLHAADLVD